MEAISFLVSHPGYAVLIAEIEAAKERYIANLARGFAVSSAPVDQRELDEKRGFWKGAIWALKVFPKMTEKDFKEFLAADPEESDNA